jgi:hypothetical protein
MTEITTPHIWTKDEIYMNICVHYKWLCRAVVALYNYQTEEEKTCGSGIPYISASKEQELQPIKTLLYGEQYRTFYDTIIVTEGVFDVFNIGIGAVATFGKLITASQLLRISKFARRVICFDNEPDTQEQAKRLCYELSLFPGETLNVCLDADDPGSACKKEIKRLRQLFLD